MDLHSEQLSTSSEQKDVVIKRKNKEDTKTENAKKIKVNKISEIEINVQEIKTNTKCPKTVEKSEQQATKLNSLIMPQEKLGDEPQAKVSTSPKKRLELAKSSTQQTNKVKFIYGNYSQYYGYRNRDKDYHDVRLDVFAEHCKIFKNKHILDIGCNSGFITMEVAKSFEIKSIVGLDIDKSLINQAIKNLTKCKKSLPMDNEFKRLHKFPFNITFVHGNYVLKDDVLLEIEKPQFDVILCLSITKWIHLNFGDKGLKQAFKRIFLQLKSDGQLILEAQPFDNYARRKKITETIFNNFKDIQFFPKDFTDYLLSSEVGFSHMELMGVPDHCKKGFKRPIQIFFKK